MSSVSTQQRTGIALSAAVVGMIASTLQQTLLATTTPTIVTSFGHPEAYPWIAGLYLLSSTAWLPYAGAVADRIGPRPMYLAGLAVFGVGTLGVAWAPHMAVLLALRVVQGLGAGQLVPAALAVVGSLQDDRSRGRAFGLMGLAQVLANVAGPLLGGASPTPWAGSGA